jgi:hypothetical protein
MRSPPRGWRLRGIDTGGSQAVHFHGITEIGLKGIQIMAPDTEQRDYYRIQDAIVLDYVPVDRQRAREDLASKLFPDQAHRQAFAEFKKHGRELHSLLANLDPTICQALKLQDKRLELLASYLFAEHNQQQRHPVSLSEGGLAFIADKAGDKGSFLALSLTFVESGFTLFTFAEVLRCEQQAKGYALGCKFYRLNDADKSLLARHILAAQRKPTQR